MTRITYSPQTLSIEVQTQNLYTITTPHLTVETHKIGVLTDTDKQFYIILDFDEVNQELMDKSIYVARGICMHDINPLVISFGGPMGKFNIDNAIVKGEIDKEIQDVVHLYILEYILE